MVDRYLSRVPQLAAANILVWTSEEPGLDSWQAVQTYLFPTASRTTLCSTQPRTQWLPGLKLSGSWNWPLTFISCRGESCVQIDLHCPIHLHGLLHKDRFTFCLMLEAECCLEGEPYLCLDDNLFQCCFIHRNGWSSSDFSSRSCHTFRWQPYGREFLCEFKFPTDLWIPGSIRSVGLWRWYINITITILDIIHRPVLYLKLNSTL
jgi:hypothetical protein